MISRPIIRILSLIVLATLLLFQCDKKVVILTTEVDHVDPPVDEPISYDVRTDRDDIPPPPTIPWWTIQTDELTVCQQPIWAYLNKIYPIEDTANPEYQIYTLDRQSPDLGSNNHLLNTFASFFTLDFPQGYLHNSEYNCSRELDANFFEGAVGEPTCVANNYQDSVITYLYYIKMRFRYGPCPITYREGEVVGSYCDAIQTQFCSTLRVMFSMQTGELEYIDFNR